MDNLINELLDKTDDLQDEVVRISEGKEANTDVDKEEAAIKKLSEQDEEFEERPSPEPSEAPEAPEAPKEEEPEIGKEYLGAKEDTYFYLIGVESDEGVVEDLQIVNQEGELVFSAKEKEVEITDTGDFIIAAIQEIDIENITYDIFAKYILPKLLEEEEEEPEEEEFGEEFPEEESPVESKKIQGAKIEFRNHKFDVALQENNTITINNKRFNFSGDFLKEYGKDKISVDGLKSLAKDVLESMSEEELKNLKKGVVEKGRKPSWPKEVPSDEKQEEELQDEADERDSEAYKGFKPSKGKMKKVQDTVFLKRKDKKESKVKTKKKIDEDLAGDVKELQKSAMDALKDGDYNKAADLVNRLSAVEGSVGDFQPQPEEKDEEELEAEVEEEEAREENEDEGDEEVVEKKEPPICKDCGKAHWPFQPHVGSENKDKEEVEEEDDKKKEESRDSFPDIDFGIMDNILDMKEDK